MSRATRLAALLILPVLAACGSQPAPDSIDNATAVAGKTCAHAGSSAISGVPAQLQWHQTAHAELLVCGYNGGALLAPVWQRANTADWYLSNTGELDNPTFIAQSADYDMTVPSPGNTLAGKYLLVAREVPYNVTTKPATAMAAFTAIASTNPADTYPGAPAVQALVKGIEDGFAGMQTDVPQLPNATCSLLRAPKAASAARCVAHDTAEDSVDRYKDVISISVPSLAAKNLGTDGGKYVGSWLLSDAKHAVRIAETKDATGEYHVTITFSATP